MGKKADMIASSVIILVILTLIGLGISLSMVTRIQKAAEEQAIDDACRNALLLGSIPLAGTKPGASETKVPDACQIKYLTFYLDKVEKEYENRPDKTFTYDYKTDCSGIDPAKNNGKDRRECVFDNVNSYLASEYQNCWSIFSYGKQSMFSRYVDDTQCLVCAVVYFDGELAAEYGGGYVGTEFGEHYTLNEYMLNEGRRGSELSYYEETLDLVDETVVNPYYDYDMDDEYAIVLIAMNENKIKTLFGKLMEQVFPKLQKSEDGNFMNRIEFIENDRIGEYCEVLK